MEQIDKHMCDELNRHIQKWLGGRRTSGWFPTTEKQFSELAEMQPEYRNMCTLRRQYDADDLRCESAFSSLRAVLKGYVERLYGPELLNGVDEITRQGLFVFSAPPRVHIQREAYKVDMYAWMHYRVLEVKRALLPVKV